MQEPREGSNGALGDALEGGQRRGHAQAARNLPERESRRLLELSREAGSAKAPPARGLEAGPECR